MKWKTRIWMWKTIVQEQVDVDCVRCTTYKSGNYIFEDCGQRKLYRIHAAGYHPVEKALMIWKQRKRKENSGIV